MNFDRQNEISNVNDIDINNNINMFDPNQMSNQMMMPNSQMGMMMNPSPYQNDTHYATPHH